MKGKLEDTFSRLFSYSLDKLQSVNQFITSDNWLEHFHLRLSVEAHQEFHIMQGILQGLILESNSDDRWICKL